MLGVSDSITFNVPVVYMARAVMILMRAKPLQGSLEEVSPENRSLPFHGPKSRDFSGSTPSNGPCNGFAGIKISKSLLPALYKQQVH